MHRIASSLLKEVMFRASEITGFQAIYIYCGKCDLRKGIDGLATLVKEQFHLDPFLKGGFCFFSADAVPTGSKAWSGKAMGSACFISGLKPDASDGREARKKRQGSHRKNFIFC